MKNNISDLLSKTNSYKVSYAVILDLCAYSENECLEGEFLKHGGVGLLICLHGMADVRHLVTHDSLGCLVEDGHPLLASVVRGITLKLLKNYI